MGRRLRQWARPSAPQSFRMGMLTQTSIPRRPCVVAGLGSSSTAGKGQAFNWIAALQQRLSRTDYVIRNFGVGGDLAYNALQ